MTKTAIRYHVSAVVYCLASLIIVLITRPEGTTTHWLTQAVLGPLWQPAAFITVCHRPFGYLDGVTRVATEDLTIGLVSLSLWLLGLVLVVLSVSPKKVRARIACMILVVFWGVVACLNTFLWSILSL